MLIPNTAQAMINEKYSEVPENSSELISEVADMSIDSWASMNNLK